MNDLIRLMFDDGATRKPITRRLARPDVITFRFNGRLWNARIIDTVEGLMACFPDHRTARRGQYMCCGETNQSGPNETYSYNAFVANPEVHSSQLWGNVAGKTCYRSCSEEIAKGNVLYMDITEA